MATTLRISDRREKMASSIALQAGMKVNRVVKVSEILNFIIDRYLNLENEALIVAEFSKKNEVSKVKDKAENKKKGEKR